MKPLLGGKGANLGEMDSLGLPVPPGFTITTEVCTEYNQKGRQQVIDLLKDEFEKAIGHIEEIMGSKFGSIDNPCLLSVRSGARDSMPGMMDTVLNIGLNDEVVEGLATLSGKEWFAWDSYRRFIQMYGDVVMLINDKSEDEEDAFELILHEVKSKKGIISDQELSVDDLKYLVKKYKEAIIDLTGENFPEDPWTQLWNSVMAVFDSWNKPRAVYYRKLNEIPDDWGTAVNVQAMVFGNRGKTSGSGVAFTRDAGTGENVFNGEYLIDAQGEDVVAGIRTPLQITHQASLEWAEAMKISESERQERYKSLEERMPELYQELNGIQEKLEQHFKDMQDLEFTIQEGKLWILQTRNGKRTGAAMVKIAIEMLKEGLIDEREALLRIDPIKIDELLHPILDVKAAKDVKPFVKGLPASPGAATGQITFFSEDAEKMKKDGRPGILVRIETSADDLPGMNASEGILTAKGGMTSHAAVVARGMGKCCVSGAGDLKIDYKQKLMNVNGSVFKEGDWITLNGSTGEVYEGEIPTIKPGLSSDLEELLKLGRKFSRMKVRTNADTPESAKVARNYGAEGIGLCRTEHMFFEDGRITPMREMILATDLEGRKKGLRKLLPMQREDFEGIFTAMDGYPVTIRLLDPPLHEFVPHDAESQKLLSEEMGISVETLQHKVFLLKEINPMLGHRGCRLGNTYPEITQMQTWAIMEAAINVHRKGIKVLPEIMIPLTGTKEEMKMQRDIIQEVAEQVFEEQGERIEYLIGTMIEVPRAALVADEIAEYAEFFSFGTNDLTQMTFGYSRDDAAKFLPIYLEKHLLEKDPFAVLDSSGVGQLVEMAVKKGKEQRNDLHTGICGEHGGDPTSVAFCESAGLDYVSCSPYRVPIAQLAAAKAAIQSKK